MKNIDVMVTAFRDGFQSAYGGRVFTKDFLPALEAAVDAGITHFEAGGGARFQALYFYCNEDAFDMMDSFRETTGPEANLQTLSRGINVVGLDSQPRDIINLHAKLFKKHGMTTIRNFDALNDVNNLIYSGQCIHDAGLKHEVCVTMMELPPGVTGAHTPEFYMEVLKKILDAGIPYDSVCFKDASGTSTPSKVYETIKQAREMLGDEAKIAFHTHETAGTSIYCYKAAIEAGADQVDCSLAPVSGGTCQPDLITLWHILRDSDYTLDIDIKKIIDVERIFKDCMADYFMPPEAKAVEPRTPFSPMPGGALTANTQMMRDAGILNRYGEVAEEMAEVISKGGFGTSVTPVSQFYFQQAFNNVMAGEWKKIAEGYGKMVLGYFGKTPVEPHHDVIRLAQDQLGLRQTSRSPIDINEEDSNKGVDAATRMLEAENLPTTEENIFIAATCKEKGIAFLKGEGTTGVRKKSEQPAPPEKEPGAPTREVPSSFTVTVEDTSYNVVIENGEAIVDGNRYPVTIQEGPSEKPQRRPAKKPRAAKKPEPASAPAPSPTPPTTPVSGDKEKIESPLPGTVVRILSRPGATVKEGEIIMVVESMKMETDITSPTSGTIDSIPVSQGGAVKTGDTLAIIIPTGAQQAPEEEQPEPTAEKKPAAAPKPKGSGARTGAPKPKATPPPKGAAASPVRPAGAKKPSERTQQIKETTIPKGEQEQVNAPLPGSVIRIDVEAGDQVEQNDVIMVIESMKMETDITSPVSGTVESIKVQKNETVKTGDLLAVIAT